MNNPALLVPTISTKSTGRSSSFTDGSGLYIIQKCIARHHTRQGGAFRRRVRVFAKAIFSADHEFGRIFRVVLRYGIAIGKYRVGQK